jgi:hypothetical protein
MEAFRASGLDYPRTTVFVIPTEVRINLLMTGHYLTILAGFAEVSGSALGDQSLVRRTST